MSTDAPIIASAVVIPPNATQPSPPPHHSRLKRRESSDPSNTPDEPSKRTRLAPATSIQDEKSRSQRLFGSILGNLGRVSQDTRTKKRLEVEAKMQEKMKAQQEEEMAGIKRSREVKEEGRKVFASHAAQVRRRNESHMANFLATKSKPKIYYRPWKLLRSQELTIEKQKELAARNRSPSPPSLPSPETKRSTFRAAEDDIISPVSPTSTRHKQANEPKEDTEMGDEGNEMTDHDLRDEIKDDRQHQQGKERPSSPIDSMQHGGDEEEEMVEY
ncbi:hypothetical protein TWF694_000496 [Orbilia ellipsospora]|uniref:Pinin/SDK/MemA protein domain-containing protein n=1 Tax=Orbilia ellipsospora TaxID=2528407 RepID=A0AAV9XRC1_9PEZI